MAKRQISGDPGPARHAPPGKIRPSEAGIRERGKAPVAPTQDMTRQGIAFTLAETQPGLWKWQFRIGETVTSGKTETNLRGLATYRVQQRIDRELRNARDLAARRSAAAG